MRGALSLLGPLMWGWLAVDLALKAIGTDYARVIRAVFMLAQVRAHACVCVCARACPPLWAHACNLRMRTEPHVRMSRRVHWGALHPPPTSTCA